MNDLTEDPRMRSRLRCTTFVSACPVEVDGRDRAEVMAAIVEHLRRDHCIRAPSFALVTRAHAAIVVVPGDGGGARGVTA